MKLGKDRDDAKLVCILWYKSDIHGVSEFKMCSTDVFYLLLLFYIINYMVILFQLVADNCNSNYKKKKKHKKHTTQKLTLIITETN